MLTLQEFTDYYFEHGRCPNDIATRKNPLNEKQLRSRYEAYVSSEEKKNVRQQRYSGKDLDWIEVRQEVFERDGFQCMLWSRLTDEEKKEVGAIDVEAIDPAHIFPKSTYPHMKYDPENVVSLHRIFHTRLDNYQNPVNGNPIARDERAMWFQRIIGQRLYIKLERKARER